MTEKKKKSRKHFKATFYWMFTLIFSALFIFFFYTADMFPTKWKMTAAAVIALILVITGVLSFHTSHDHKNHYVLKTINIILAVLMALCSILLPYYESRVSNMIANNNDVSSNKVKVNVYVMSDSYKAEHSDIFGDAVSASYSDSEEELKSHADDTFITLLTTDGDYQKQAIEKIEKIVGKNIAVDDKSSVQEAAAALYSNEAPVMLMSTAYASMLDDMAGYENFDTDTRIIYTVEVNEKASSIGLSNTDLTTKPFAVFIGGNDEEGDLTLTGRTDVDIVLVVNPVTYQIGIFSYPRDSYVPNPAANDGLDKLTHLGIYGLDNTMNGLGNVLGVDIDNYVLVNFTTFQEIMVALDGVDVDNPYEFVWNYGDYTFPEGRIHLDANTALMYVRERHSLPDGDFGRNMHEQIVMQAILEKVTSPSMLVHFDSLISALDGKFLTNLTSSAIYSFMKYQLDNNIHWNMLSYRAEGYTDYAICASAPSQELAVVLPYDNQLTFMEKKADQIIDGEILTQEDMPEGEGIRWEAIHGASTPDYEQPVYTEPVYTPEITPEPVYTEPAQETEQPVVTEEPAYTPEPTQEPVNTEPAQETEVPADNGGETVVQETAG